MKILQLTKLFILIFSLTIFVSCLKDDDDKKDWSEIIELYVDSETGIFKPFDHDDDDLVGIKIREHTNQQWWVIHLEGIEGFVYEVGYAYKLKVEKIHLGVPKADGSDIKYKLLEILSKE